MKIALINQSFLLLFICYLLLLLIIILKWLARLAFPIYIIQSIILYCKDSIYNLIIGWGIYVFYNIKI